LRKLLYASAASSTFLKIMF